MLNPKIARKPVRRAGALAPAPDPFFAAEVAVIDAAMQRSRDLAFRIWLAGLRRRLAAADLKRW